MNRLSLIAFIIVFTAFGATKVLAAQPTIIIYSGTDSGFGYKMAELLQKDVRIDSQVRVVNSPDLIVLAATLPQTECIVIYAEREAEIEGLEET
ncbi:MAG: hypothetical protein HXS50_01465, partial [Theionarchaea archaeon]|nr:hypothetical protein [Theionarchaea archaeon]